jgi:hypothetical protein
LYDSIEHKLPLLPPGHLSFFLPKLLAKADKAIEEGRSGTSGCRHERHGPYYYAYWKDSESNKLKKKYIGRYFEENKEDDTDDERSTRTQCHFT